MKEKKIKIVLGKPGLNGHDRGIKVVARGLMEAGMEVVYLGPRLTPEQIADAAIEEDADVVGVSNLSAAHTELYPRVAKHLKEKGAEDILVVGGGIIPEGDRPKLEEAGIKGNFGPGTPIPKIVEFIKQNVEK